jgi:VanZ family protein
MIWRREHRRFWYLLGLLLLLLLVLAVLYTSLAPPNDLPPVQFNDKLEHGTAYVLMMLWFGGLVPVRQYGWLIAALLALGGGIEIAQGLMNLGRTADIMDFAADAGGVAVGLLLCLCGLRHWAGWIEHRFLPT